MDANRFDASLRALATSAGRREAVRSLGAVGLGLLAVLGLADGDAGASGKRRKKRRGHQRNHAPSPAETSGPAPPASLAHDSGGETAATGLVGAEAKKKKPKPKPGPTGPIGPTGPTGATGATGTVATAFFSAATQLPATLNAAAALTLTCKHLSQNVLGGGYATGVSGAQSGDVTVNAAFPTEASGNTPQGYQVNFTRTGTLSGGLVTVSAFLVCTP
jgi:hypothetical protein